MTDKIKTKRMKQLCRYVGQHVTTVKRRTKYSMTAFSEHVDTCIYCPIPKYRKDFKKCPAAGNKRACSSELIDYFVEGKDE